MAMIDDFQDQEVQKSQEGYLEKIEGHLSFLESSEKFRESTGGAANSPYLDNADVQRTMSAMPGSQSYAQSDPYQGVASMVAPQYSAPQMNQGTMVQEELRKNSAGLEGPSQAYFGNDPAYQTTYASTFFGDMKSATTGSIRATQNMYQSDFNAVASRNFNRRLNNIVTAPAALIGLDSTAYDGTADDIQNFSHRYITSGSGVLGTGLSQSASRGIAQQMSSMSIDNLGATFGQYRQTINSALQSGMMVGVDQGNWAGATDSFVRASEDVAKATGYSLAESSDQMFAMRRNLGIGDIDQQAGMMINARSLGMASGLRTDEILGFMNQMGSAGGNVYSATAASMGMNQLGAVNSSYINGSTSLHRIQAAGGVNALAGSLTSSSIGFANSMGGAMNIMGGTSDIHSNMAAAAQQIGSAGGYANFVANRDEIVSGSGASGILNAQKAHLMGMYSGMSESYNMGSSNDVNMMKMMAVNSGIFGSANAARAFVEQNMTTAGIDSGLSMRASAISNATSMGNKRAHDLQVENESITGYYSRVSNKYINKPWESAQQWVSEALTDNGAEYGKLAGKRSRGEASYKSISGEENRRWALRLGDEEFDMQGFNEVESYSAAMARGILGGAWAGAVGGMDWGSTIGGIAGGVIGMIGGGPAGAFAGLMAGGMAGGSIGSIVGVIGGAVGGAFMAHDDFTQRRFTMGESKKFSEFSDSWNKGSLRNVDSNVRDKAMEVIRSGLSAGSDISKDPRSLYEVNEKLAGLGLDDAQISNMLKSAGKTGILNTSQAALLSGRGDKYGEVVQARMSANLTGFSGISEGARGQIMDDAGFMRTLHQFISSVDETGGNNSKSDVLANSLADRGRSLGLGDDFVDAVTSASQGNLSDLSNNFSLLSSDAKNQWALAAGGASKQSFRSRMMALAETHSGVDSSTEAVFKGIAGDGIEGLIGALKSGSLSNANGSTMTRIKQLMLADSNDLRNQSKVSEYMGGEAGGKFMEAIKANMDHGDDLETVKKKIAMAIVNSSGDMVSSNTESDVLKKAASTFDNIGNILADKLSKL